MNKKKIWEYNEGKALIYVYGKRKEEYLKCTKKNIFWQNILTDLERMNVLISPTTIQHIKTKWKTLYRAYKGAIDKGNGSTTTKFMYMEEMEEIFSDDPLTHFTHFVGVGDEKLSNSLPLLSVKKEELLDEEGIIMNDDSLSNIMSSSSDDANEMSTQTTRKAQKRIDTTKNLTEIKKDYYEAVIKEKVAKRKMLQNYLENKERNKEKRHAALLELLKMDNGRLKEKYVILLSE